MNPSHIHWTPEEKQSIVKRIAELRSQERYKDKTPRWLYDKIVKYDLPVERQRVIINQEQLKFAYEKLNIPLVLRKHKKRTDLVIERENNRELPAPAPLPIREERTTDILLREISAKLDRLITLVASQQQPRRTFPKIQETNQRTIEPSGPRKPFVLLGGVYSNKIATLQKRFPGLRIAFLDTKKNTDAIPNADYVILGGSTSHSYYHKLKDRFGNRFFYTHAVSFSKIIDLCEQFVRDA